MLLATCYLLLVSCGFHLRSTGKYELAPALATLRVAVAGSRLQNDPLAVDMKNALRTQTDAQVEDAGDAPLLLLHVERSDSQLLSVDSTGRASEYLLRYEVSFQLVGRDRKPLAESQTVRVQRTYTFDRLNVLSTEREQADLQREMQRDAVQQILRRLSKISSK